jgi:hypothetical protein
VRSRLAPTVRTLPKGILGVTHFPPARIVGTNHKVKRVGQGFGASASDSFRPTLALRRRLTGSPNRNVVRSLPTLSGEDPEILAWHRTAGCSNGPTEAINLLIKQVKRVGHGFRNFANYRLRLLLHCGVRWQTHRTARLRSRVPGLVA